MVRDAARNAVIKWLRWILAGAAIAAVVLFGLVAPGQAKGPVSATITGPGIAEPMELIGGTEPALVMRFMEQTGLWYGTGDLPRALTEPPIVSGPSYTLTWINGGPPERSREERTMYQEIYVASEHSIVIHTPSQRGLNNWGPGVIGWFSAPSGLWDTLLELGVPLATEPAPAEGARAAGGGNPARPQPAPANTARYVTGIALALIAGLAGVLRARRPSAPLNAE